jgi:hypothetical protein
MDTKIEGVFRDTWDKVLNLTKRVNPAVYAGLQGSEIMIGRETSAGFAMDAEAILSPSYVGDSYLLKGDYGLTPEIKAMMEKNQDSVGLRFVWDSSLGGYVRVWEKMPKGVTTDSMRGNVMDAVGPIINGSLLSPSAISWFKKPFVQQLAWSNARKLVSIEVGTSPWAEVMNLPVAVMSGAPMFDTAGSPDNTMSNDVEVTTGVIAQPIINIDISWKLSIAELERSKSNSGVPYVGSLITLKPAYAKWLKNLITDVAIYYGNGNAGTTGILNINAAVDWNTSYTPLPTILANGSDTHKGQTMYSELASAIRTFMTTLQNQVKKIVVGMTPDAYNILNITNYSENYESRTVLEIFNDVFKAGEGEDGSSPTVEFYPDPLLTASDAPNANPFNDQVYDYLVISAPEMGSGPYGETQPLLSFGMPLEDFVYPTMPQQMSTQYRELRRISGVFAPNSSAVAVYYGYGQI